MEQETKYENPQQGETTYTCKYCGKSDFGGQKQLAGHIMTCKPKHDKKEERKERIPFGTPVRRFNAPSDDGFHYRVFNDNWRKEPGRIQRARAAGYEFVDKEVSGTSVGTNDDGSEIKGVLMRLPQELYEQDQAAKQKEVDLVDEQTHRGRFGEGSDKLTGGVKIETKLTG